ncbi:hypothetical protein GCM10017744_025320 [Streptomyces antimycoticus]
MGRLLLSPSPPQPGLRPSLRGPGAGPLVSGTGGLGKGQPATPPRPFTPRANPPPLRWRHRAFREGEMEPNTLLDSVLDEAGVSHAGLAAHVNEAGRARG